MRRRVDWVRHWIAPWCAALALAVLAGPLSAQVGTGRITGQVRDASTGEPLAGVQVHLEGTGLGTLTQANGRYFLINVPAGTYTMVAEYLGYATIKRGGVLVAIDVARTQDFELTTQALALQEVVVEAERVPLVEVSGTGSRDIITAEEIAALPVSNVSELLALQHGFFELPMTTDMVSFLDQERGMTLQSIRGGRADENITMVDGIPVTSFIMGDVSFNPSTISVEQTDYSRGGFEAKYGNALSGVVNIRTREPREFFQGSMTFQSSAFGGLLGSTYDELRGAHQVEGFISGPIPGTNNKLMFVVTASNTESRGRVLEFDDHVFVPWMQAEGSQFDTTTNLSGHIGDLTPGWRAMGFNRSREIMSKLQYRYSPTAKLTLQVTDSDAPSQGYGFNALRIGFDLYGECVKLYPEMEDLCSRQYLLGREPETIRQLFNTSQANQWVTRNATTRTSRLYAVNWDHTMPAERMAYNLAWGRNEQFRDSCSYAAGWCFGPRVGWNQQQGPFLAQGGTLNLGHAVHGTSTTAGGDRSISQYLRGDLEWQATDNHNISTGFFFQQHDIFFNEWRQVGNYAARVLGTEYGGKPWDGALYVQDRVEYDFVTVRLGLRFDYGRASGKFFANPQDPTNGTTAYHVCENPTSFGYAANKFEFFDTEYNRTVRGIAACSLSDELMETAVLKAMEDDFQDAKARRALSPRLGVSFPLTENSSLFFNYGRFTQNPRYHNLYQLTGIGTPLEGSRDLFAQQAAVGARRELLIGNAHLLSEQTSNYELGYITSFDDGRYGMNATMYMKDQYNLTGYRSGGIDDNGQIIFDPGSTYRNTTLDYVVLLNLDFQTSRGLELTFRRRLENYWAFDLRYAYSQTRTNAAPPEQELQRQFEEGDRAVRREIRSHIDRPHTASLVFRMQVDRRAPEIPFGDLLRNSSLSLTGRYSSGTPYTPQLALYTSNAQESASPSRLERNSATSPATYSLNLMARKNFTHAQLNWGAFVRVDNLLNTSYCVQVYQSTGRCDGGQLTRSRLYSAGDGAIQQGASISTGSAGTNSQQWDRPDYFGAPRAISAGISVTF